MKPSEQVEIGWSVIADRNNFLSVSIIGNWSDHETVMQEKFGKDLTLHQVKHRTLKR
jgi:hypothetical protein